MENNQKALPLLVLAAFFWSTSGVLIKLVSLPSLAIAGYRSLVAAFVILILCRKEIKISWGLDVLAAAVCMGLFCISFVLATKLSTAANAIVLQYSASAYVAVLAPFLIKEPTRRQDWMVLVIVILGIALFFMDDISIDGFWGILIGIAGGVFWAMATIFLRKSKDASTAWPLVLGNFIAAGLCLPFMYIQEVAFLDVLGILGLGIISIGAGYAIFSHAIKKAHALEAVLVCSIEPLINPLWVFFFAGEIPGPWALAGAGLVLTAVFSRSVSQVILKEKSGGPDRMSC